MGDENLGNLVDYKQITNKLVNKRKKLYSPTLEHSERFVEMTQDENPLHRAHDVYPEAISPGFMQTSVAVLLIKEAMREKGVNPADYPFSVSKSTTGQRFAAVVTGAEYRYKVDADPGDGFVKSSVIIRRGNDVCYSLERKAYADQDAALADQNVSRIIELSSPVYTGGFMPKVKAREFGNFIGSDSSESNLFAISGSSSVVFQALEDEEFRKIIHPDAIKNLKSIPPILIAMYTEQNLYSDASGTRDLQDGINLELYLSEPEKFGAQLENNRTLNMQIAARNDQGQLIYVSQSPISFQRKKLWDLMMKRSGVKKIS